MKRGEVWWAGLPLPIGKRPAYHLSRDEAYYIRNAVMVAEITTTIRGIPVEVPLGTKDGLPK
jgi:mRNA interferase MazF